MRYSISDVAEYGDLSRGPRVVDDHVREKMQRDPRRDPQRRVRARADRRRRRRAAAASRELRSARAAAARGGRQGAARARRQGGDPRRGGAWRRLTSPSPCSATAPSAPRSTGCSPRARRRSSARPGTGCASSRRSCATGEGADVPAGRRRPDDRLRGDPRRPLDRARRRGDGRRRADRRLRARAAPRGQAGRDSANKQLLARRERRALRGRVRGGVQLRFEASVCAAIPVIKVLRESLVVTNVHRVLGIVNGDDELHPHADGGGRRATRRRSPRRSGSATRRPIRPTTCRRGRRGEDGDPRHGRVRLARRARRRRPTRASSAIKPAARRRPRSELGMVVRLVGAATLVDGAVDVRVGPALVDRHHPLAAVEGAFNAVMLQGDAIREITLEGPGAGGIETASAVVADMVSVLGTTGTGFLQNDAVLARARPCCRPASSRSPFYVRIEVADRPGVLAPRRRALRRTRASRSRGSTQHLVNGSAALDVVTHEAPRGQRGGRAGGDRRARRGARAAGGAARDLGARRLMRPPLLERYRDACRSRRTHDRHARRGRDAARCRRAALGAASASRSGSSGRARTRPARSRTAA